MMQPIPSPVARLCGMWHKNNIRPRKALPARNVLVTTLLMLAMLMAAARPAAAESAAPLDEAIARQAFRIAELWLQQAEIPSESVTIEAAGVTAVHVTLRLDGRRLGNGTAQVGEPDTNAEAAVDLMPLIRSAMRSALREAFGQVNNLADRAEDLALDIQFGHSLRRLDLDRIQELPYQFVPGHQGLAMRRGDQWAWSFPASVVAMNTHLTGQINRLLAELDLPLDRLALVGTVEGPPLYRFEAIHLVRVDPAGPLHSLYRGNRLLSSLPLDDNQLAALTDQLLEHLLGRVRDNGQFLGTYQPTPDTYSPQTARPVEAASAAFALARASRLNRLSPELREAAAAGARRSLARLTSSSTPAEESATRDLAAASMTLIALLETPGTADLRGARDRLANAILARHLPDGLFNDAPRSEEVSLATHALATAALVRYYDRTRDPEVLKKAHLSVDAVWQRLTDASRASDALPWLVMAELDLDRLDQPTGYRDRLVEITTAIWRDQIQPWHEAAEQSADVVGGFVVREGFFPEPTWQTSRIIAGQAIMLHDADLLSAEQRTAWLVHSALGTRFLAQLTMQPESAFYASNRQRAIGGVRSALSNNRQPVAATAMSLIATIELENALLRLAAASR